MSYAQRIGRLIPYAEIAADKAMKNDMDEELKVQLWNKVYHDTMDRLATANGIRRQTWQG